MRLVWVAVAVGLAGCGEDSTSLQFMDDDFPAGGCRDTDGAGSTAACETEAAPGTEGFATTGSTGSTAACGESEECDGGHCVAPWDPVMEIRGEFACEFACIDELDERRWCSDDASCCNTEATCTARGYCIVDVDGSTSSGGSTSGTTGA